MSTRKKTAAAAVTAAEAAVAAGVPEVLPAVAGHLTPGTSPELLSGITVQLNRDDIVNIFVDRAETQWQQELEAALAAIDRLGRDAGAREQELQAAIEAVPANGLQARANGVVSAYAALGVAATALAKPVNVDRTKRQVLLEAVIKAAPGDRTHEGSGLTTFNVVERVPAPAAVAALLDDLTRIAAEQAALAKFVKALRTKLNNIPALERKSRAQLTRKFMARTDSGRAALDELDASMAGEIDTKALRALCQLPPA